MRVTLRSIGDVLVLDVDGELADRDELNAMQEQILSALARGVTKFVLDFEHVSYINSTGLGIVVHSHHLVHKAGAFVVLCHPSKRLTDLFSLTKLITLFQIHQSLDSALQFYAGGIRLQVTCPRCVPQAWILVSLVREYQQCALCGMEVKITLPAVSAEAVMSISATTFRLPTYEGECVSVVLGAPTRVLIDGRLDLFAAEAVEQAVRLIPSPRSVVFSLGTDDLNDTGMAALVRMCETATGGSAISLNSHQWTEAQRWKAAHPGLIHDTDDEAIAALQAVSTPQALSVSFRRSDM